MFLRNPQISFYNVKYSEVNIYFQYFSADLLYILFLSGCSSCSIRFVKSIYAAAPGDYVDYRYL